MYLEIEHPVLTDTKTQLIWHKIFQLFLCNCKYECSTVHVGQYWEYSIHSTTFWCICEYSKRKNTSIHSSSLEKPELDQSETYYIWGEHTDFFHVLFFSVLFTSKSSSYFFFFWKQDHYMTYGPIIYAFQPISMMLKIDLVI